jgi:hypothetical protein
MSLGVFLATIATFGFEIYTGRIDPHDIQKYYQYMRSYHIQDARHDNQDIYEASKEHANATNHVQELAYLKQKAHADLQRMILYDYSQLTDTEYRLPSFIERK